MIAGIVVATTTLLLGQAPRTPQPDRTAKPVFRSGVEAVEMDVFVTDKNGRPVSGLTKDDFEVFEDGKPQVITTFAAVSMPIERREPLPFSPEPDVLTNEREPRHVYLILLGVMDEVTALQTRVRVKQFLAEYFGDNDMAAIFAINSTSTQDGQDFTSNRRLLRESIDKFTGQAVVIAARHVSEDLWQHMELLSRIPAQRKSVLLFGSAGSAGVGDVFNIIDYRGGVEGLAAEYAHAAVAAASHANIPIYPINPSGEVNVDSNSRALAALTGGFALTSGNNYDETFERLVNETSTFYVLGFNSAIQRKQGRHISLQAVVKRPGLQVRTRDGYVEQLEYIRAHMPAEPRRTPVETALASPLATSGIPLRVFAAPFKRWDKFSTVALTVELDGDHLGFTSTKGVFATDFEIRHLATDVRAKIHPEFQYRGSLSLDTAAHDQVTRSGVRIVSQFDLPAGRYQVRVASARGRDNGSVVYDLVVPDFTDGKLAMSGVAITSTAARDALTLRPDKYRKSDKGATTCRQRVCQAGTTFSTTLSRYATARGDAPLLRDVLPAPPTTSREFASTDTLTLFAEVYDNSGRSREPYSIGLTATLHDPGGAVVRQAADQHDSKAQKRPSGGHGFTLTLPLNGVPAGSYVLRTVAGVSRDEKLVASRAIPITVR
jgi:VWFA-related protein